MTADLVFLAVIAAFALFVKYVWPAPGQERRSRETNRIIDENRQARAKVADQASWERHGWPAGVAAPPSLGDCRVRSTKEAYDHYVAWWRGPHRQDGRSAYPRGVAPLMTRAQYDDELSRREAERRAENTNKEGTQ
jgi:hypothetical protein